MKLSISNIGWDKEQDKTIYEFLNELGFDGIEIAPTRIIEDNPYCNLDEAKKIANSLLLEYNLQISSMQSIWYGRNERIFKSEEEYNFLLEYTKKAIDFASEINCKNIVFGCPKNRNIESDSDFETAKKFFVELGNYAESKGTVLAIEPNPEIYNTNFLNTTLEVFDFVKKLNCRGIGINLDLGTIIENDENIDIISEVIAYINHIHISEPYLEKIKARSLHKNIAKILKSLNYDKYVSIEMKNLQNISIVKDVARYIKELF